MSGKFFNLISFLTVKENVCLTSQIKGKTIVLVTHDLKIANYADRIIRLEQGKIV